MSETKKAESKKMVTIERREANDYSEIAALGNIMEQGPDAVSAHLKHLEDHGQTEYLNEARTYLEKKGSAASACARSTC